MFSGCSPTKVTNVFRHAGMSAISCRTFNMIQRHYLIPAVINVWTKHQQRLLSSLKTCGRKATLGGDARCDSPGHSAKYSNYTLMDLKSNKGIDVQLIHVISHDIDSTLFDIEQCSKLYPGKNPLF